mmetsp:Transcript_10777/g.16048  ORF Transcript_10777/g.16048 Transcript_10777/m.16048 type:complete len:534 (+) Transcript_10777:65-1666(+)
MISVGGTRQASEYASPTATSGKNMQEEEVMAKDVPKQGTEFDFSKERKEQRDNETSRDSKEQTKISLKIVLKKIWILLLPTFIEGCVNVARRLVFFVFVRTTIDCGQPTPDDVDRSSGDWSGSKYCNDRCKVAEEAQFIKGLADGAEAAVKFLCLPSLGLISDIRGRNLVMTISMVGLFLAMLFFSFAARERKGGTATALIILSSVFEGATAGFNVAMNACIGDLVNETRERGYTYGVMEVFRLLTNGFAVLVVTGAVISQNLYDYENVFWGITVFAALAIPTPYLLIPETNKTGLSFTCSDLSPFAFFRILAKYPYVVYIAWLAFFAIFGISVLLIANAFVIGAYGWTQTFAIVMLILIGIVALFFTAASSRLIAAYGARAVARRSLIVMNIGLAILCFSPLSVGFFILGCLFLVVGIMAVPSLLALISKQVPKQELGVTLAAIASVVIAATAIASPVYSTIFRSVGSGGECGEDTDLSLAWVPWGLATVSATISNIIAYQWHRKFPESMDAGESSERRSINIELKVTVPGK